VQIKISFDREYFFNQIAASPWDLGGADDPVIFTLPEGTLNRKIVGNPERLLPVHRKCEFGDRFNNNQVIFRLHGIAANKKIAGKSRRLISSRIALSTVDTPF